MLLNPTYFRRFRDACYPRRSLIIIIVIIIIIIIITIIIIIIIIPSSAFPLTVTFLNGLFVLTTRRQLRSETLWSFAGVRQPSKLVYFCQQLFLF